MESKIEPQQLEQYTTDLNLGEGSSTITPLTTKEEDSFEKDLKLETTLYGSNLKEIKELKTKNFLDPQQCRRIHQLCTANIQILDSEADFIEDEEILNKLFDKKKDYYLSSFAALIQIKNPTTEDKYNISQCQNSIEELGDGEKISEIKQAMNLRQEQEEQRIEQSYQVKSTAKYEQFRSSLVKLNCKDKNAREDQDYRNIAFYAYELATMHIIKEDLKFFTRKYLKQAIEALTKIKKPSDEEKNTLKVCMSLLENYSEKPILPASNRNQFFTSQKNEDADSNPTSNITSYFG